MLAWIAPAFCIACGAYAGRAAPLCRACRALMHPLVARVTTAFRLGPSSSAWATFPYEGPAGALVRELKFRGRVRLADLMAAQMAAHAPPDLIRGVVVPVPAHPLHSRRRGVDHARVLAAALARRTGLPLVDCLVRAGDPQPQVGRSRRARMAGPLGSIAVRPGADAPRVALLVDDVVTTGATAAACVTALKAAGTEQISALAYARTTAR